MNEEFWKHVCAQLNYLGPMLAVLFSLLFLSVVALLYGAGGSKASMTILVIDIGLILATIGGLVALSYQCERQKEIERDWRS